MASASSPSENISPIIVSKGLCHRRQRLPHFLVCVCAFSCRVIIRPFFFLSLGRDIPFHLIIGRYLGVSYRIHARMLRAYRLLSFPGSPFLLLIGLELNDSRQSKRFVRRRKRKKKKFSVWKKCFPCSLFWFVWHLLSAFLFTSSRVSGEN